MKPTPAQLLEICYALDNRENAPCLETESVSRYALGIWKHSERFVELHPMRENERRLQDLPEAQRRELVFAIAKEAARTGGRRSDFERAGQFVEDSFAALGYYPEEHFQSSTPWKQETDEILFQAFDDKPAKRQNAIKDRAEKNRADMARMIEEQLASGSMEEERAEFLRAQLDAPRAFSFAIEEFRAVIVADISAKRSKAAKSRKKV